MNYTCQPYATAPGGCGRNLQALIDWDWGVLATAGLDWHWKHRDLWPRVAIDNGAWMCFTSGKDWDSAAFIRACDTFGGAAEWVAVPDIVAGGIESLRRSVEWLPRCEGAARHRLVPVQDGMSVSDVAPMLGGDVGIFLGGSTPWKLRTMRQWGDLAKAKGVYLHVGRVNSAKRIRACIAAGAHSTDGTSATRYSVNVPRLSRAHQEVSLWNSI